MKVIILWSLILILAVTCIILKKKVRWLTSLALVAGITFFTLLTPDGKVLWQYGWCRITEGSLQAGLFKSGILIFLQLFSKIFISAKIKLPGKAGQFVNQVFAIYEKLTAGKFPVKDEKNRKIDSLIASIDEKLISAWNDSEIL